MGYNTSFEGKIVLSRDMTLDEDEWLDDILSYGEKLDGPFFHGYLALEFSYRTNSFTWDGSEKSYDMQDQLKQLIHLLKIHPTAHDIVLNGSFLAQGEEIGDIWRLDVKENEVTRTNVLTDLIECPNCSHRFKLT